MERAPSLKKNPIPRSSWYYRHVERDERESQKAVEQVIEQFPTYGSRRAHPSTAARTRRVQGHRAQACAASARRDGLEAAAQGDQETFSCPVLWDHFSK